MDALDSTGILKFTVNDSEIELTKDDLDFLAENVLKSTFVASNPKAVTKKKVIDLYKEILK